MSTKLVVGAFLFVSAAVSPGLASAYDCTGGGQQIATTALLESGVSTHGERFVTLRGMTTRSVTDSDNCPGWVRIEGWIWGDPNGAMSHQASNVARIGHAGEGGPIMFIDCAARTYEAKTKHWYVYDGWLGDSWHSHGELDRRLPVPDACPPPPPEEDPEEPLPMNGSGCPTCNSPLLLDLDRDGYKLTSPADGVLFDLDSDGVAEQVAWTRAEPDDAWLALDRNGNGRIDDGSELIGNRTPAYADNPAVTSANGFEALKFMEGPTYGRSVADGVINSRDGLFSRLLLWRDLNHNGISEPDELQLLRDSGVLAIHTEYKVQKRRDAFGNEFRQKGKGVWPDGEFFIYDVWLRRQD